MTMNFRNAKRDILAILEAGAAAGLYQVIGSQGREQGATESKDSDRICRVYFADGQISKTGGSRRRRIQHDCRFAVELTTTKATKGDLATLEDPLSTDADRLTALAGFIDSKDAVDSDLDEFFDVIFNILMNAENCDFGTVSPNPATDAVSNTWIPRLEKNPITALGNMVTLTGIAHFECRVSEVLTGATPVPAEDPAMEADLEFQNPDSDDPDDAETGVVGGD